ncbi:MAG: zf-HC2 domain-containing protein [Anaerolineae bacterium]|nr:zf-HC2 domain-containing protein [Anaerolineae bacterium]
MGNREHRYVDRRLSAYLDGELGNRERARVEAHLARCQECRASMRALRWTKQLLQQAPAIKVPRSFVVREADVARPQRAFVRRPLAVTQWATAVVALLFVLVLGGDLLLGARLPGALDARSWRGGEGNVAAPVALQSEQVTVVEGTAPVEATTEMVVEGLQAPSPVEEPASKAAPEGEGARDAPPAPPPGIRGEFAEPVTTTVPGEPMMALAVPQEAYTETQQLEDAAPEAAAPEAAAPEAAATLVGGAPIPGTTVPHERGPEQELDELPSGGGGLEPQETAVPGEADDEWAETEARAAPWRTVWLGVEALLGVALLGLVVAVVWMRARR